MILSISTSGDMSSVSSSTLCQDRDRGLICDLFQCPSVPHGCGRSPCEQYVGQPSRQRYQPTVGSGQCTAQSDLLQRTTVYTNLYLFHLACPSSWLPNRCGVIQSNCGVALACKMSDMSRRRAAIAIKVAVARVACGQSDSSRSVRPFGAPPGHHWGPGWSYPHGDASCRHPRWPWV